jgi:GTP-binding protein LepA
VHLTYDIPLSELITDFFDVMKSISSGYASLDYEFKKYEAADIEMVIFHLNGEPVDALTFLIHSSRAVDFSKGYCRRLKELLPP